MMSWIKNRNEKWTTIAINKQTRARLTKYKNQNDFNMSEAIEHLLDLSGFEKADYVIDYDKRDREIICGYRHCDKKFMAKKGQIYCCHRHKDKENKHKNYEFDENGNKVEVRSNGPRYDGVWEDVAGTNIKIESGEIWGSTPVIDDFSSEENKKKK